MKEVILFEQVFVIFCNIQTAKADSFGCPSKIGTMFIATPPVFLTEARSERVAWLARKKNQLIL